MNIVVFEDSGVDQLFPITTGRPAYAITSASFRLVDWVDQLEGSCLGLVRAYLEPTQKFDFPQLNHQLDESEPWTLVLNARLSPSVTTFRQIQQLLDHPTDSPRVVRGGWAVAAAVVPTSIIQGADSAQMLKSIEDYCNGAIETIEMVPLEMELFQYPHDVVRQNLKHFRDNLQFRIESGRYTEIADGVFAADPETTLAPHIVTDSSDGPILIERNAKVGPFTLMCGPIYLGENCRVNEHAAIKDCVSLGHTTKIGGEIEATVIEPYSNKQHHGFLGHSYLGSWINLGAGTCNSDLKNTYGVVNMEYSGKRVSTEMQFIGCIIGDYSKSAINTGIFTGKTIGVCSMIYGFVTTNVPSFVNYARLFGQTTELPPSVMQSTQKRMFGRRNVEQRACDLQLINDMYLETATERQLSEEPLVL